MSLRLIIEGCSAKVSKFLEHMRTWTPHYRLYGKSMLASTANESKIECYLDQNQIQKPQISKRVSRLEITTTDQTKIEITLLNAVIYEMGKGHTFIHGTNFDIFAGGSTKKDV